jgi:hypothetical protein
VSERHEDSFWIVIVIASLAALTISLVALLLALVTL